MNWVTVHKTNGVTDAEKRGMSGILWLLLVLIGNVIGLLIYAIVRSETPVKRRTEGAGGSAGPEKCPGCGKAVDGSWKTCPACGASIDPGDIRQV